MKGCYRQYICRIPYRGHGRAFMQNNIMRIIGVDPGTLVTGFGVIDWQDGHGALVEYGVIRTLPAMSMPLRLGMIYTKLAEVIERTLPDEFAIESAFYSKNVQSTLKLGHARGVAILTAVLRQIPTGEYAPREVKKAVTGTGSASKESVEYMVMRMLQLTERHAFLDATDALAVALCHALRGKDPLAAAVAASAAKDAQSGQKPARKSRGKKGAAWGAYVSDNPDRVAGGLPVRKKNT